MTDKCYFESYFVTISLNSLIRFWWNFACCSRL